MNEFILMKLINQSLPGPHDMMTLKRSLQRQRRPYKSGELDSSWTTKWISTKNYTNTLQTGTTNWLGFEDHGFKGHRNVFRWRHTDRRFAVEDRLVLCMFGMTIRVGQHEN